MITFTAICLGLLSLQMSERGMTNASATELGIYYTISIIPALVGAAMIYGAYR